MASATDIRLFQPRDGLKMWRRGGQSSSLDRAQALLSAKKNGREVGRSTAESPGTGRGLLSSRPAPPNTHAMLSDLSDLSSSSSAPEHGANPTHCTAHEKNQPTKVTENLRSQSSLGGGGSRFLKKASPHVTNSCQSPASRRHMEQMPDPRYVSSSHRGSQAAVLSRLAQIESRIHSRLQPQKQARERPQPAHNLISNLASPQEAVTNILEASTLPTSVQSRSGQNQKGKRYLKNKGATSEFSVGPDADVRPQSRDASAAAHPSRGLEIKSVKVDHGVSLESDEEDMRKLLGDSLDSSNNSFFRREQTPSVKKTEKILGQTTNSTHSSAAAQHLSSSTALPRSPASPSNRSSPFRFTGQAQAHFSPSAVSPSPSPPCVSPSLSRRLCTPRRVDSPQHSVRLVSAHSEVLSLEEFFPVQPASEDLHSVMSVASSEELNVMTLDELVPAASGFTEKMPRKQRGEHNPLVFGSPERRDKNYRKAEQPQHKVEKEEDMLDYQSDFESESQTQQSYSASQVSEQLMANGDEEEAAALEVRDEGSVSDMLRGRTETNYSDTFSVPSRSQTSDYSCTSETLSRCNDSRSPLSQGSQTSSHHPGRRPAARRVVKEAAVQMQPATYTWPTDITSIPVLGMTFMNPTSGAGPSLSSETVQALSTYNPVVFVLNEMLKHQLATTRQFIERSRNLHTSLVQSLEPPNYRYTTLEETKEYICMRRPSKLTKEEALKEVMKEYHCTVCD